jgi:hypothetical protein
LVSRRGYVDKNICKIFDILLIEILIKGGSVVAYLGSGIVMKK